MDEDKHNPRGSMPYCAPSNSAASGAPPEIITVEDESDDDDVEVMEQVEDNQVPQDELGLNVFDDAQDDHNNLFDNGSYQQPDQFLLNANFDAIAHLAGLSLFDYEHQQGQLQIQQQQQQHEPIINFGLSRNEAAPASFSSFFAEPPSNRVAISAGGDVNVNLNDDLDMSGSVSGSSSSSSSSSSASGSESGSSSPSSSSSSEDSYHSLKPASPIEVIDVSSGEEDDYEDSNARIDGGEGGARRRLSVDPNEIKHEDAEEMNYGEDNNNPEGEPLVPNEDDGNADRFEQKPEEPINRSADAIQPMVPSPLLDDLLSEDGDDNNEDDVEMGGDFVVGGGDGQFDYQLDDLFDDDLLDDQFVDAIDDGAEQQPMNHNPVGIDAQGEASQNEKTVKKELDNGMQSVQMMAPRQAAAGGSSFLDVIDVDSDDDYDDYIDAAAADDDALPQDDDGYRFEEGEEIYDALFYGDHAPEVARELVGSGNENDEVADTNDDNLPAQVRELVGGEKNGDVAYNDHDDNDQSMEMPRLADHLENDQMVVNIGDGLPEDVHGLVAGNENDLANVDANSDDDQSMEMPKLDDRMENDDGLREAAHGFEEPNKNNDQPVDSNDDNLLPKVDELERPMEKEQVVGGDALPGVVHGLVGGNENEQIAVDANDDGNIPELAQGLGARQDKDGDDLGDIVEEPMEMMDDSEENGQYEQMQVPNAELPKDTSSGSDVVPISASTLSSINESVLLEDSQVMSASFSPDGRVTVGEDKVEATATLASSASTLTTTVASTSTAFTLTATSSAFSLPAPVYVPKKVTALTVLSSSSSSIASQSSSSLDSLFDSSSSDGDDDGDDEDDEEEEEEKKKNEVKGKVIAKRTLARPSTRSSTASSASDRSMRSLFKCGKCDRSFSTSDSCDRHVRVDHGAAVYTGRMFNCALCAYKARLLSTASRLHVSNVHGINWPEYHNRYIAKPSKAPANRNNPNRNEPPAAEFRPPYRAARMRARNDREREDPLDCATCGRGFTQRSSLDTHQKYFHSSEKQFGCRACGARFKYDNNMCTHVRKSHGLNTKQYNRQYPVGGPMPPPPVRRSTKARSATLTRKSATTAAAAPAAVTFECSICPESKRKKYKFSSGLENHVVNVHGINWTNYLKKGSTTTATSGRSAGASTDGKRSRGSRSQPPPPPPPVQPKQKRQQQQKRSLSSSGVMKVNAVQKKLKRASK